MRGSFQVFKSVKEGFYDNYGKSTAGCRSKICPFGLDLPQTKIGPTLEALAV